MTQPSQFKSREILGYRLIERIGSGGYGEVWRAEAPGGLLKAVKILYGFHDERRAQAELKSLSKIKQLRHPFLLSLERIDIVDDQLVVITELADRTLADLFNDYLEKGASGIPRDELLEYLKQAAEALDFIATEHNLQHLDVKPENLLLVGRHAKLADFGLVKKLQECTQSLLGGLTPAYAAPELFDGRPSLQSDQYSLALVFHEMLCGTRCFDGNSPAQLAAQHMQGQPNLSRLSKSDQAIVARALSKQPNLRFKSCRSFVEELINRKALLREKRRTQIPARTLGSSDSTSNAPPIPSRLDAATQSISLAEIHGQRREVKLVPPPHRTHAEDRVIPTLFIGVGRTGTQICQFLKQQISSRFGNASLLPSFQVMCLDSDRIGLATAANSDGDGGLTFGETCSIPLRKPEDYRERGRIHSQWLNRRWLYNIPKSMNTEGLRPLGRLAFVDHFQDIWQRLESTMEQMLKPESLALTADQIGQSIVPERLRVFIVTSISGGVGSGLALDLAYTAKMVLREFNCSSDDVHGIMLNSCDTRERESGIALANSFAFLTELRHFTEQGYPGDSACGLPELHDELPFDFPYFLSLGNNLSENEWTTRLSQIADYLFINAFKSTSLFFDDCREMDSENEVFSMRSFGIASEGINPSNSKLLVETFQRELINRWLGKSRSQGAAPPVKPPLQSASVALVASHIKEAVHGEMAERDVKALCAQLTEQLLKPGKPDPGLFQPLRAAYGCALPSPSSNDTVDAPLASEVAQKVFANMGSIKEMWAKEFSERVGDYFHEKRLSLANVCKFLEDFDAMHKSNRDEAKRFAFELKAGLDAIELKFLSELNEPRHRNQLPQHVNAFVRQHRHRLEEIVRQEIAFLAYRFLLLNAAPLKERILRLRMILEGQMATLRNPRDIDFEISQLEGLDRAVIEHLLRDQENLVDAAEIRFFHQQVEPIGTFEQLLLGESMNAQEIFRQIGVEVGNQIVQAGCQVDLDQVMYGLTQKAPNAVGDRLTDLIERAKPPVDFCGGEARLLVSVPEQAPSSQISESIERLAGVQARVAPATCGSLTVVMETDSLSLAEIAFRLLSQRGDCIELASRIATRNDVSWKSLEDLVR